MTYTFQVHITMKSPKHFWMCINFYHLNFLIYIFSFSCAFLYTYVCVQCINLNCYLTCSTRFLQSSHTVKTPKKGKCIPFPFAHPDSGVTTIAWQFRRLHGLSLPPAIERPVIYSQVVATTEEDNISIISPRGVPLGLRNNNIHQN